MWGKQARTKKHEIFSCVIVFVFHGDQKVTDGKKLQFCFITLKFSEFEIGKLNNSGEK